MSRTPLTCSTTMMTLAADITEASAPHASVLARRAFDIGVALQAEGQTAAAEASFRQAIAAQPDMAEAWSNLGMLQEDAGQFKEAEASYVRALSLNATLYPALMNLATLLANRRRFAEAEACYKSAIQVHADDPAAWSNLGAMLTCMRREDDAQACLLHALRLNPDYDKARFNLGYLWMRQGRLAEGWLCNESRLWPGILQGKLDITRWAGEALEGRSILIAADAAHGDLIHLVRYVPLLKAMGAGRVAIWGQGALKRWLSTMPGVDAYFAFDEPFAPTQWDVWVPMLSLMHLCGTTLDTIPADLPYLRADPTRVAHRAAQGLARRPDGALRVGLVWRGTPLHENDAQRSLSSLAALAPLWQVPGVRFISLQSGAGADEAVNPPTGLHFEPLAEPLGDFFDTATVVANLDLVIGVDTSIVHVAGALGVPVWVLLSDYKTDWRWMNERTDSPWYPGVMRLFRQDASGEWAPVVARIAQALAQLMPARLPRPASSARSRHAAARAAPA
ncbi:MAG: tetratricopeptide repeat-containing glycosyltransferase family protein [Aquabacterium sp.]